MFDASDRTRAPPPIRQITLSLAFITRVVPLIRAALDAGDVSMGQFERLEAPFREEIDVIDQLVAASYQTFHSDRG